MFLKHADGIVAVARLATAFCGKAVKGLQYIGAKTS